MDATAVHAIQESVAVESVAAQIPAVSVDRPIIALPKDVGVENIEKYLPHRRAFRGQFSTQLIDDFVGFCKQAATEHSPCFIDASSMEAKAVFDYAIDIGGQLKAGHGSFFATLKLKATAEYTDFYNALQNRGWNQRELAHFLEDNAHMLDAVSVDGASIPLVKAISAVRRITIDKKSTSTNEAGDMSAKRSLMESVEANSNPAEALPAFIGFTLTPYVGLKERRFIVRVVAHLTGEEPKLTLKPVRLEQEKEKFAKEFSELLTDRLDGVIEKVYIGNFQ